ncbi:MAG: sugar kinase [Calditrichaeota bacterium]|nr:MAG: sugar kinase [Calditrichota bacterium]
MDLVAIGTIGYDSIETPTGKADKQLGGTAVYLCLAASYFCKVGMVAASGKDFLQEHLDLLTGKGVDLEGVQHLAGDTFHWGAKYHQDLNVRDTLFTHLNVLLDFTADLPPAYREAPFYFLGNIDPALQMHVIEQAKNPVFIGMDTMNYWINSEKYRPNLMRVLEKTQGIFVNDEEARDLSGEYNLVKAANEIRKMGPEHIVIKKGEHGAMLFSEGDIFYAPAFPLEVVHDPTGAGDSFAGGFMGYLTTQKRINNKVLREAMIYGSALASYTVEDYSVNRVASLENQHVDKRYQEFSNLMSFGK